MSKRHWLSNYASFVAYSLALVAAGLVGFLIVYHMPIEPKPIVSADHPVQEQRDARSGSNEQNSTQQSLPEKPPLKGEKSPTNADTHKCKDDTCFQEKDLIAQESMARSTSQLVGWTIGQVFVGVATTALLVLTLILSNQANKASARAVEIAEKHMLAAERPWINVSWIPRSNLTVDDDGLSLDITLTLNNCGKIPAINVLFEMSLYVSERAAKTALDGASDGPIDLSFFAEDQDQGRTMFPDSPMHYLCQLSITREEILHQIAINEISHAIADRTRSKNMIYPAFAGRVTYRSSISKDPHQTGVIVEVGKTNRKGAFEGGIDANKASIKQDKLIFSESNLSVRVD